MKRNIYAFLFAFTISLLILFSSSLIPKSAVHQNIYESCLILENNNVVKLFYENDLASRYDINSDSLILNIVYNGDSLDIINASLKHSYYNDGNNLLSSLKECLNNNEEPNEDYLYNWWGSIALFRLMLVFFNINDIRFVFLVLFVVSFVLVLFSLLGSKCYRTFFIYAVSLIVFRFYLGMFSLDSIICLIITNIMSYFVVRHSRYIEQILIVSGMLISFFSLFTMETISLTIPLMIYLISKYELNNKYCITSYSFMRLIASWVLSFLVTSLSKVVLCSALYGLSISSVIHNGSLNGIDIASSEISLAYNIRNIVNLNGSYVFPLVILCITVLVSYLLLSRNSISRISIYLFIIGMIPIFRIFILNTESYVSSYTSYRSLVVSFMFILFLLFFQIRSSSDVYREKRV